MVDAAKVAIALLILIGFLGAALALFFFTIPTENREAVAILFGNLATMSGGVVNWFFGSSKSSQAKDELIHKIAGK